MSENRGRSRNRSRKSRILSCGMVDQVCARAHHYVDWFGDELRLQLSIHTTEMVISRLLSVYLKPDRNQAATKALVNFLEGEIYADDLRSVLLSCELPMSLMFELFKGYRCTNYHRSKDSEAFTFTSSEFGEWKRFSMENWLEHSGLVVLWVQGQRNLLHDLSDIISEAQRGIRLI